MDTKFIGLSKTMWINLLTLILGILTVVVGQTWIPVKIVTIIACMIVPVLNMILRWLAGNLTLTPTPAK